MRRNFRGVPRISWRCVAIAACAVVLAACVAVRDVAVPGTDPWGTAFDGSGRVWVAMPGCDPSPMCSPSTPPGKLALFDPPTNAWITVVSLPTGFGQPLFVAVDRDGKVWFTMPVTNAIGRFDPVSTSVTQWAIPTSSGGPWDLAIDGNGKVWFTEHYANKIGAFDPGHGTVRSTHKTIDAATMPVPTSRRNRLHVRHAARATTIGCGMR